MRGSDGGGNTQQFLILLQFVMYNLGVIFMSASIKLALKMLTRVVHFSFFIYKPK